MNELVKNKMAQRFKFLSELYQLSKGKDSIYFFTYLTIGENLGFDKDTSSDVYRYLKLEKLISATGGLGVALTHKGVTEYEQAVSNPEKSTDYFPQGINNYTINVYGDVSDSQFQQILKILLRIYI